MGLTSAMLFRARGDSANFLIHGEPRLFHRKSSLAIFADGDWRRVE